METFHATGTLHDDCMLLASVGNTENLIVINVSEKMYVVCH